MPTKIPTAERIRLECLFCLFVPVGSVVVALATLEPAGPGPVLDVHVGSMAGQFTLKDIWPITHEARKPTL